MKTLLLSTTLGIGLCLLPACGVPTGGTVNGSNVTVNGLGDTIEGSGISATETREVDEFHAVRVAHAFKTVIEVGVEPSFEITGDDNLLSAVSVEVQDGVLVVEVTESYSSELGLSLRIGTPTLDDLDVGGAAKVEARGIDADAFRLEIGGAAEASLDGRLGGLELETAGSSTTRVAGITTGAVAAELGGASSVTLDGTIEGLRIEASGSANCAVTALTGGEVHASLSGASDVTLDGTATRVTLDASGASAATFAELTTTDLVVDLSGASRTTIGVGGTITGEASGASRLSYSGSPTSVDVETSPAASVSAE